MNLATVEILPSKNPGAVCFRIKDVSGANAVLVYVESTLPVGKAVGIAVNGFCSKVARDQADRFLNGVDA